jgi:ABC-2 type transport system ATP-binding protein
MNSAIKIKNVTVVLGGYFKALRKVRAELPQGKIIGFIGPSGAGKTTLIRAIVGRQKIASGEIAVFDIPAGSAQLRSQLSYMTQELSVYADLTVQENLRYFAVMFGIKRQEIPGIIANILQVTDMTEYAKQLVSKLSGGQKQRVSLAISLIGFPKLMVLDEPTVGLDPVLRDSIWKLFRQLSASGTTLIVSSHVMDEAERCDDLLLLRDGKILAHDSPEALCQRTGLKTVEQSFLKLVEMHS